MDNHDKQFQMYADAVKNELIMAYKQGGIDKIDEFAHQLKETFNAECPINYESTKPFFTLDNVRMIVDMVAAEMKSEGK